MRKLKKVKQWNEIESKEEQDKHSTKNDLSFDQEVGKSIFKKSII
jgi:hypothetical protein